MPTPGPGQLLLEVHACGLCRTDLHLLDGEVTIADAAAGARPPDRRHASSPARTAASASRGSATPAASAASAAAAARTCASGRAFTGCDIDGGMAQYAVADERFCFPIPDGYPDLQAAPLLCAGLIGYRALRMCGDGERLGIYGFGAAAHIICQVARWQGRRVFAFTRPGDTAAQAFARELGAVWAGDSAQPRPSSSTPRSSSRPTARCPDGARGARARRDGRLRRHPHERDPGVRLRAALARAHDPLGRQPDPPRRRGVPRARPAGPGQDARDRAIRSSPPTRHSTICATGAWSAPPC